MTVRNICDTCGEPYLSVAPLYKHDWRECAAVQIGKGEDRYRVEVLGQKPLNPERYARDPQARQNVASQRSGGR